MARIKPPTKQVKKVKKELDELAHTLREIDNVRNEIKRKMERVEESKWKTLEEWDEYKKTCCILDYPWLYPEQYLSVRQYLTRMLGEPPNMVSLWAQEYFCQPLIDSSELVRVMRDDMVSLMVHVFVHDNCWYERNTNNIMFSVDGTAMAITYMLGGVVHTKPLPEIYHAHEEMLCLYCGQVIQPGDHLIAIDYEEARQRRRMLSRG